MAASSRHITPIVLAGAGGRMGQALMEACAHDPLLRLAGALEKDKRKHKSLRDLSCPVSDDAAALLSSIPETSSGEKAILIDFTIAGAPAAIASQAAAHAAAYIVGTTGLSSKDEAAIKKTSAKIPVFYSGNMSLGVALLAELSRAAAKALHGWDIEILEMHHAQKEDAPSGTALLLGEAAAKGRGKKLASLRQDRKAGRGRRKKGSIGFASLRGGSLAGDHSVIFAGKAERILLHHSAEDRGIFAQGALQACHWIKGKKAGLYSMADMLDASF